MTGLYAGNCYFCGKKLLYAWDNGFIRSLDVELLADWLAHVDCLEWVYNDNELFYWGA